MHKLNWSFGDLLFVVAVSAVCIGLAAAWWRFRDTRSQMIRWRRITLCSGLLGNTISLAVLLGFLALSLLQSEAMLRHPGLQVIFSFLFWTVFSFATALAGASGDGAARVLVMINGVLLTSIWYLLGLANSL